MSQRKQQPRTGRTAGLNGQTIRTARSRSIDRAPGLAAAHPDGGDGLLESRHDLSAFVHPVCPAGQIKTEKPHRFWIGGIPYVLWKDRAGEYHCVDDECPHRRASLACGVARGDAIYCAYHNWRIGGDGQCSSPSDSDVALNVPAYRVFESLGYLWMTAGEPQTDSLIPRLEGWSFAGTARVTMNAPLEIVVDNFSENEHVPWVHGGLGWCERRLDSIEFNFEQTGTTTRTSYRARQRPNLLFKLLLVRTDDIYVNEFVARFDPLNISYYISWESKDGGGRRPLSTCSTVYFVPESAHRTTLHFFFQYRLTALRLLEPMVKRSIPFIAWKEALDDKRFIENVMAGASPRLQGMRLRKFDKPIAVHRKYLEELYFQKTAGRAKK